jgi:hypothetical protein
MKYRGVKIVRVKANIGVDIGKRESSPVKPIIFLGYSPVGVGYPMEKQECFQSIDNLINRVMTCCKVTEREAVKLLNQT